MARSSRGQRTPKLLLGLCIGLSACSLSRFKNTPCAESAECRDAFGLMWVCGAEGYCETTTPHPRCGTSFPEDLLTRPDDYPGIQVIGAMADAAFDSLELQATRLAFLQAEGQGGFDGQTVGLVECSYEEDVTIDGLDYDEAVTEVGTWLIDVVGVKAIVGPLTSAQTTTAYTSLNEEGNAGVLILSPAATSPALTYLDGFTKTDEQPGLLWRTCPPDSLQGQAAAQDMINRDRARVAVVYQTGPYGAGLQEFFLDNFSGAGREADAFEFETETERDVALTEVAEDQGYDEIFFISAEVDDIIDCLNFFTAYTEYDRPDFGIFLADGAADIQLIESTPGAGIFYDQIRGSRPAVQQTAIYDAFAGSYYSEYGEEASDSIYTAYAYDAGWLALYSLAWATYQEEALTGTSMAKGMRRVSAGLPLEIRPTGWSTARAAFEEGQSIDVEGVSGSLDFDPETEETSAPIEIWVINQAEDGFDVVDTVYPE